jgi:hypothetical protein
MLQDVDLSYVGGVLTTGHPMAVGGALSVAGGITAGADPSTPVPGDHGLLAWSHDPSLVSSSTLVTNGTVYLSSIYLRRTLTVSKCWVLVSAVGVTAVAGQNFIGLINSAGTVLSTAGMDAAVVAAGPQPGTLATPQVCPAGQYWVAMLANASTAPTLAKGGGINASGNNVNLAAATLRFATNGTTKTALANIVPGSNTTAGAIAMWAAVS